jgi:hypothetical protein
MNSVLPPEMEEKRLLIARSNNWRALWLIVVPFVASMTLMYFYPKAFDDAHLPLTGAVFGIVVVLGFIGSIKYNRVLSRRLGFVCPKCGKPLYDPDYFIQIDGKCPRCKKQVFRVDTEL